MGSARTKPRFKPPERMPDDMAWNPDPGLDDGRLMFAFAHDLRTHLRTVLTRIQLVQTGKGSVMSAEDQMLLQEAAAATTSANGLLNAMVAYCDVQPASGVMSLRLLLQGALLERKAALTEAGGEVEVVNELDVPAPLGLQSVLKELLTNSCKFRDKARPLRIRISSRIFDGHLEIVVIDNGVGVDAGYLEKIFVPFQRLHSRDEIPGNGLGLATGRRVTRALGGTMLASSVDEGGLTIRITVPASQNGSMDSGA
jgi:signal transduction histidine kinase